MDNRADVDEVREAIRCVLELHDTALDITPYAFKVARFAHAVLSPPPEVAEAMERIRRFRSLVATIPDHCYATMRGHMMDVFQEETVDLASDARECAVQTIADYYLSLTSPLPAGEKGAGG